MRPTENTPPVRGDECVVAVINLQDRASHEADVLTSRLGEVLGERIAVLRIGMYERYVMAEGRGHLYFYGPSAEDLAAALLANCGDARCPKRLR